MLEISRFRHPHPVPTTPLLPLPQGIPSMSIPIYRQNIEYDDWEVASVYDSDSCDSMGRSASYESSHSSRSLDEASYQLQGPFYDDSRPRADYVVPRLASPRPASPPQRQNYPAVAIARSRWDAPGKRNNFVVPPPPIVPPPGVIFPPEEWVQPPQDVYRLCTTPHVTNSSGMGANMGTMEPPPSSLLLSPSTPPRASPPLIRRPSPTKMIGYGPGHHATTTATCGAGTGLSVTMHGPPITPVPPPPPRYHEMAHTMSPCLAEAGCQVRPGTAMSPRTTGLHDVLSTYGADVSKPRESQTSEEIVGGRGAVGVGGGHYRPNYGPGDRAELYPHSGPSKYEHERPYGRGTMARERRPSMWKRFVRRFTGPSGGVSVGHA